MIEAGELIDSYAEPQKELLCHEVDFGKSELGGLGASVPKEIGLCTITSDSPVYVYVNFDTPMNRQGSVGLLKTAKLEWLGRKRPELGSYLANQLLWRQPVTYNIGFDPEIFLHDGTGKLLPAPLVLPDKKNGIPGYGDHNGPVYSDGFAAEITTGAGSCLEYQCTAVRDGLLRIRGAARATYPKADFLPATLVEVEPSVMESMAEEHCALGCMPSYNAYGLQAELPTNGRYLLRRVVGGHIHNATPKLELNTAVRLTRVIDAILGVASVSLFDGLEHPARRRYYGLPGEFRLPKHGYEYRVLSNCWLWHPTIMHVVVDLERAVLRAAWAGLGAEYKAEPQEVIETIRDLDVEQARTILDRNRDMIVGLLRLPYHDLCVAEAAFALLRNGMSSKVREPQAIGKNWALDSGWEMYPLEWRNQWHRLGI